MTAAITWSDLTAFQRDTLEAISRLDRDDATVYGLAIKRVVEDLRGEEINHGRLYPNLDELAETGLVEKSELDKRTNEYALTHRARSMLEGRVHDLADATGLDVRAPATDGGGA